MSYRAAVVSVKFPRVIPASIAAKAFAAVGECERAFVQVRIDIGRVMSLVYHGPAPAAAVAVGEVFLTAEVGNLGAGLAA